VKFSRHAKNRMRRWKWTPTDVRRALDDPRARWGLDPDGNPLARTTITGTPVRIIIAQDDPDFVITIFESTR